VIGLGDVEAAARRLDGVAHRTPVFTSRTLGRDVWLKAENLQRVGAFKFRGAYNAISSLTDAERARGVAAVSSGNHAQAVALAARLCGASATILMPEDAPASKRAATEGYGATVIPFDRYTANDRDELLWKLVAEHGHVAIHPFDDERVMAGQGTVALELLEQVPKVETLIVPVGGGGLISGCSVVAAAAGVRVFGVEPEAGDDFKQSLAAGERITIPVPKTIADGQQTNAPGEKTFAVVRRLVQEVVTVSDEEIVAAMRFAFERLKLVLEPSGATGLAALMHDRVPDGRTAVVLSGGNVDTERFKTLLS
jgi:threo-3-hydroxy-L-aspartate ammonia-lyase